MVLLITAIYLFLKAQAYIGTPTYALRSIRVITNNEAFKSSKTCAADNDTAPLDPEIETSIRGAAIYS